MKIIKLSTGHEVLVSDQDYDFYSQWKWQLSPTGYVARSCSIRNIRKRVYLHRLIMCCPSNKVVDHINKNRLDNRRENLRVCTQKQNTAANSKHIKKDVTEYKGVSFMSSGGKKVCNKFRARVYSLGIEYNLGCFNSAIEAARAYDVKNLQLNGEFAYTNFPKSDY